MGGEQQPMAIRRQPDQGEAEQGAGGEVEPMAAIGRQQFVVSRVLVLRRGAGEVNLAPGQVGPSDDLNRTVQAGIGDGDPQVGVPRRRTSVARRRRGVSRSPESSMTSWTV